MYLKSLFGLLKPLPMKNDRGAKLDFCCVQLRSHGHDSRRALKNGKASFAVKREELIANR